MGDSYEERMHAGGGEPPPIAPPKPGWKTSSFGVLVLVNAVLGFFVVRGKLTQQQANTYAELIRQVVDTLVALGVMGWVSNTFIKERGKISTVRQQQFGEVVKQQVAPKPLQAVVTTSYGGDPRLAQYERQIAALQQENRKMRDDLRRFYEVGKVAPQ